MKPPSEENELVASENATGTDTIPHEENEAPEDLSDTSDAGWDTDLEIEGRLKVLNAFLQSRARGAMKVHHFAWSMQGM